jgi:hypothetical protein
MFCPTGDAMGWGVLSGACTTRFSETNHFVSYGTGGFDPSAFKRVKIDTGNAAQMDNFAKWYAFNRTRILAMKTAGGIAFSRLDENSRVGFNTYTNYPDNFLNVVDFTPTNKDIWFRNFYSAQTSDGKPFVGNTATFDAMWRIGQYFANLPTALPPEGLRPALPGLASRSGPPRSRDRQVPGELPPAGDRRLPESAPRQVISGRRLRQDRQRGRHCSEPAQLAGQDRVHPW